MRVYGSVYHVCVCDVYTRGPGVVGGGGVRMCARAGARVCVGVGVCMLLDFVFMPFLHTRVGCYSMPAMMAGWSAPASLRTVAEKQ